ncbi:MAG: family transposase [Verrucomicrobiales bacterium]|nr:family transposase [Verrucomicrobiales bacterium]
MTVGKQRGKAPENPRINEVTDMSPMDGETAEGGFGDARLDRRFKTLLDSLFRCIGGSIPLACQDWAATKAAYRFFSNPRVSEEGILAGHFEASRVREQAAAGPFLIMHDTTEFTYQRQGITGMGLLKRAFACRDFRKTGRPACLTVRGMLMHSSMAFTLDGLPPGLTAIKFWTRSKFKGAAELKRHVNTTRIPIREKESFCWLENLRQSTRPLNDPGRCVHIGDRGSDIFELFCAAQEEKTHFLFRTCVDRYAGGRGLTTAKEMETPDGRGMRTLQLKTKDGKLSEAQVEIRYRRLRILPPEGKKKRYPALELTVIHVMENGEPEGREPVKWRLLTDLPVTSVEEALEKTGWYALRWKIEIFHKILKSGCKAEESLLRSSERLVKLISVFCIVSWRVFRMTMLNRAVPDAPPDLALTEDGCRALDQLTNPDPPHDSGPHSMSHYLTAIARLGGYLARRRDPPPGNMVIWRGLRRLADIMLGVQIQKTCG